MKFEAGGVVHFPVENCASCPLRTQCTRSVRGRSVSINAEEQLLSGLRARQQTSEGRAKLRERVGVEHGLSHVGHWQGDRARYCGTRKNLLDLRRCAVVHNLHHFARQPEMMKEEILSKLRALVHRSSGRGFDRSDVEREFFGPAQDDDGRRFANALFGQ
jgi:DDE family transposase